MSLIDTWAATGAGAFTLTENGLYTVEAWRRFLGRLNSGGLFTVSRWYALSTINAGPMPWFWSINGGAGVLAASIAVVTSIAFSIDTTLRIGAACYLLVAAPAVLLVSASARSIRTDRL